ncbi:Uncharacterised protein [Klebsiella variicola]|nr:Uncharacterised protein [Klebsiella variicola]
MPGAGKEPQLFPGQHRHIAHDTRADILPGIQGHVFHSGHLQMLPAGQRHPVRSGHQQRLIERFQPLLKHPYLAVHIRFQGLRLLCRHFQLLQLLVKPVDFLQGRIPVQCVTLRFRLRIRADKQPFSGPQGSPLVGTQFGPLAATLSLAVHQMARIQLRLSVLRGEFDVFLTPFVFHPQLVVRRGAQHVAGVIVPVHQVGMFGVVQRIRDVRQINITVAVRYRHFGAIDERRMPAQRFTGIRLRHPQPQVAVTRLRPLPVEVQLHPVAPLPVQVCVGIIFFATFDPGRERTRDDRARDLYRTEAVTFGIRLAPD